jgi:hypothetical protein
VTLLGDFDIPGQGEGERYWAVVWTVYAVLLAIPLWLTYFIYQRRNWARWGLLVYFIFSWLLDAIGGTPSLDEFTVASSIYVAATAMQVTAIFLLFTGQRAWWLGGKSASASAEA